jgi:hypothetical protein
MSGWQRLGKSRTTYDMRFLTTSATGPGGLPAPTALDIAEGLMYEKAIMELVGGPGLSTPVVSLQHADFVFAKARCSLGFKHGTPTDFSR